ncbi:MAG: hypothetical protein O2970_10445 [Proteobacteria bacterium]|nr:hypothetical protein [Pseudomonadota bacterium]MDA0967360.1 hypothetical protein [Pseudomonadota bacterium]
MAILIYPALFLTFLGIVTGTCTMASDDVLAGAVIIASPFYIVMFLAMCKTKQHKLNFFLSIPSVPFLLWQAYWFAGLFANTNIKGNSTCTWKMHNNYGVIHSIREYFYAPYFLLITALVLISIYVLFQKYRNYKYTNIITQHFITNSILLVFLYISAIFILKVGM